MMKHNALVGLLLGLAFCSGCREKKPIDDSEVLKETLFAYFDGIRHKDFEKMAQVTTADFVLYEMGRLEQ